MLMNIGQLREYARKVLGVTTPGRVSTMKAREIVLKLAKEKLAKMKVSEKQDKADYIDMKTNQINALTLVRRSKRCLFVNESF